MIEIKMRWQVFTIENKSKHSVWQYNTLEKAEKQYDLINPNNLDKKELQQVLILRGSRK